ncbi:zinc finger protein 14 [Bombus terrestris]|uniref:Zinc finger protein 14 n=1 Tax=Bombus terrestris TaxID=30195 RepID=A0A9B2MLJ3_BOMTE|nr:zinc finger protein 14 [Bombus terrestris]
MTERMNQLIDYAEPCTSNSGICRLCLRVDNRLISIFDGGETSKQLRSRIRDCCPIRLFEDDRLPKTICRECEGKIAVTFEFREQCRKSDRVLRLRYESCRANRSISINESNWKIGSDRGNGKPKTIDSKVQSTFEKEQEENSNSTHFWQKSEIICGEDAKADGKTMTRLSRFQRVERCHVEEGKSENNEENRVSKESGGDGGGSNVFNVQSYSDTVTSVATQVRYLCDICSKTFASKSGLRFHLKSHDAVKPYPCRYCDKRFVIPSYTKRHEKIHTGDKRFVCQFCSATFASSNGLKYHLRLHSGEANYHCEICGKSFYRDKYLKEHVFTHTGEKPYVCKACGASYASSGSLFVHKKRCKNK